MIRLFKKLTFPEHFYVTVYKDHEGDRNMNRVFNMMAYGFKTVKEVVEEPTREFLLRARELFPDISHSAAMAPQPVPVRSSHMTGTHHLKR